jgi:cellulose synthase operon protein C
LRFDDAIADYEKLYDLSYHNATWMEKVAETRARQGQVDATVKALRTAFIEGRPEAPSKYFEVAQRLENWNMLPQAREYCEQGTKAAGKDLLVGSENQSGARMYARLLTRMRQLDIAYSRMMQADRDAGIPIASPKSLSATEAQLLARDMQMRRASAHAGLRAALKEIGNTVNRYYTPEERLRYRQFLAIKRTSMTTPQVMDLIFPMAEGVDTSLEARYRLESLLYSWSGRDYEQQRAANPSAFTSLQQKRMKYDELARELESYAATLPPENNGQALSDAAQSYRSAGDAQNELRILADLGQRNRIGSLEDRYFELMLAKKPTELVALSAQGYPDWRDRVANFIVAHGDPQLAQSAIETRSRGLDPVWQKSYKGITGLYFRDATPEVNASFLGALGDDTIGTRISTPTDRKQRLAGSIWFYYGSRYGEYRSVTKNGDAEDFLPANIELSPARAAGYYTLAEYYVENGKTPEALADFNHVLELSPDRTDIHDRLAVLYWDQGKRDDAIAEWKLVFGGLSKQLESRKVPGSFWSTYTTTVVHLGTRKLVPQFRPAMDSLLRTYVKTNGTYQSQELLRVSFNSLHDPAAGVAWLLDLAALAPSQSSFLTSITDSAWIAIADREPLYKRQLELAQQAAQTSQGNEREFAEDRLVREQLSYIEFLMKINALDRGQAQLDSISAEEKQKHNAQIVPVQLRLSARIKTLDSIVEGYKRDPEHPPALNIVQDTARVILSEGDKQSARKLLEYVFARQIDDHQLSAPTFLGLAEIRLDSGDLSGAMELLRRMSLTMGGGFENLDSSAALLLKHDHPAEAAEFLLQLVKAVPWNPEYRVRLAEAQIKAGKDLEASRDVLAKIAASGDVPYATRAIAAKDLAGTHSTIDLRSGELKLLAAGTASAADAAHPFYYDARLLAAEKAAPAERVQILRTVLEDWPDRQPARVKLFKAAVTTKRYLLAVGAVEPILVGGVLEAQRELTPIDDEEDTSAESQDFNAQYSMNELPQVERALLAANLGEAFEGVAMNDQALRYFRLAYRLERSQDKKKQLQAKVTRLREQLDRKSRNESRRPVIHPALEQDRVVRPRLIAKAPGNAAAQPERRSR